MSDVTIASRCGPTLAGIKTANLFACHIDRDTLFQKIKYYNLMLKPRGLRMIPLKVQPTHSLIYCYRPARLAHDLADPQAKALLEAEGYPTESISKCLHALQIALSKTNCFPHVIGLFLGYPPEDVRGFIEHKAKDFKCVGNWKVYGNSEVAERKFEKFKRCTDFYTSQIERGLRLEQLTFAKT